MKLRNSKATFIAVLIVTLLLSYVSFFGFQIPGTNARLIGAEDMRFGIDIRGGVDASFAPKDLGRLPTKEELEAARTVIETRLDQRNILDRDVTTDQTNGMILLRFPWKADETDFDPAKAIQELGSMAHLTFRDPSGNIVLEGKDVVKTSSDIDRSSASGRFVVHLELNDEGRRSFAEATGNLVGKSISIYMDDQLISSPTVRERIDSNECQISDIATGEEAKLLSNQINSGALPFSLTTEDFNTISPDLGANALAVMVQAGIWAFALICLALILYYRASGIVASISLLLQIAGILIMITWPQITVTLSGIAGIILSIGMGVDANIIAAERIRDELRQGRTIDDAVSTGFRMAFSSVFDGNITVLIVAVIMMWLGSGSMLSFGYTLLFGIVMNFVAGVTATRLMTFSLVRFPLMRKPTMFLPKRLLSRKETRVFPFYNKRKIFFAVSAVIMVLGLTMFFTNGMLVDIQFKGGTILTYEMSETIPLNIDEVDNVVTAALPDKLITAQTTTNYATGQMRLKISLAGDQSLTNDELLKLNDALNAAYPEQGFEQAATNSVSAFFGQRFLTRGMAALALSALLIILYVWFSFRKIHGLSAGVMSLLALLHDILVVFFAFIVFRIPIGDAFVTVALTIIGYSINDTIVIYDRIRENAQKYSKMPVNEMVDLSISQSFTRSLNTNLCVFVSVLLIYIFAAGNGLDSVKDFALPMAVGTISGCYSTVFIAGPLWTMWQKHKQSKLKAQKA